MENINASEDGYLESMECKVCGSTAIQFRDKWCDTDGVYSCLDCGRTIITTPENEDKKVKV